MYLNVLAPTVVKLEDADNFRSFKVVVAMPNAELEAVRRALASIALLPDRDTAWVFEQALRQWPEHAGNAAWQEALTAMIGKARPHGWVDDANKTIKAHVEWPAN
jgi:hypothetical protein